MFLSNKKLVRELTSTPKAIVPVNTSCCLATSGTNTVGSEVGFCHKLDMVLVAPDLTDSHCMQGCYSRDGTFFFILSIKNMHGYLGCGHSCFRSAQFSSIEA